MEILLISLGLTEYLHTWQLQQAMHARCQKTGENIVILTEHLPVVTLGYRCQVEQLRLSRAQLAEQGIPVVTSQRGGGATYHGPGQLVAYPIFSTLFRRHKVRSFITLLEEVMRTICANYGLAAERKAGFPGVWADERKIGAVGIAVQRGTSLHGFALNICVDLTPFSYIVPCGLTGTEITSIAQEVKIPLDMRDAVHATARAFQSTFSVPVKEMDNE